MKRLVRSDGGQSLLEFALVLPLILMLALGVVEASYAILDQQVVTKLTREGSNLISRDTSLQDAVTAMKNMSTRPLNFTNGSSKVIFSVIKRVATVGASNYNHDIIYQRYEYGSLAKSSALQFSGGSFGAAPDFEANNSDNDTSLQVTNLPANLTTLGGMLYVTEIYTHHQLITPLDRLGVTMPDTLYSIAYF
ncbi:MAG: TadE/TadG family type IV pilus assembly protein [Vicinamibacterales bacterium]